MNTHKTSHAKQTMKRPSRAKPFENSTDATRGQPLVVRAQQRRDELAKALAAIPDGETRERNDIEIAIASVESLLTGDPEHLSDVVASDLNRWLEQSKHLAEHTPHVRLR